MLRIIGSQEMGAEYGKSQVSSPTNTRAIVYTKTRKEERADESSTGPHPFTLVYHVIIICCAQEILVQYFLKRWVLFCCFPYFSFTILLLLSTHGVSHDLVVESRWCNTLGKEEHESLNCRSGAGATGQQQMLCDKWCRLWWEICTSLEYPAERHPFRNQFCQVVLANRLASWETSGPDRFFYRRCIIGHVPLTLRSLQPPLSRWNVANMNHDLRKGFRGWFTLPWVASCGIKRMEDVGSGGLCASKVCTKIIYLLYLAHHSHDCGDRFRKKLTWKSLASCWNYSYMDKVERNPYYLHVLYN